MFSCLYYIGTIKHENMLNRGQTMAFPKTVEQKQFEELLTVMSKIMAMLPKEYRTKVFDYIVYLYNKNIENK